MNMANGTLHLWIESLNDILSSVWYRKQCPRLANIRKIPRRVPELTKVKKYR